MSSQVNQRDKVIGPVTSVTDGDTFEMDVKRVVSVTGTKYNNHEKIRVQNLDAPEWNQPGGAAASERLRRRLTGKTVECTVFARDVYHRLVCDVKVIQ